MLRYLPERGQGRGAAAPLGARLWGRARRPVAGDEPDQQREHERAGAEHEHARAPALALDQERQRRLTADAAQEPDRQGEAGKEGEAVRRDPGPGQEHAADEAEGPTGADQRASEIGHGQVRRVGEDHAAGAGHQHRHREHPTRAPAVDGDADRHLHHHVGIEVTRRQVAEDRPADREVAHQLLDHDAGRDAQHPGVEEEHRRQEPAGIADQARHGQPSPDLAGDGGACHLNVLPPRAGSRPSPTRIVGTRRGFGER